MTDHPTLLGRIWEEHLHPSWRAHLVDEWTVPGFRDLAYFLESEYQRYQILPQPPELIFNAFNLTPFDQVRVVILGQDPYPNPENAHGLAFSVRPGVTAPMSLRNIFIELEADLGGPRRRNGTLIDWAQQGVLLLNTCLTVRTGQPGSHAKRGWESLTDRVLQRLSEHHKHLVFILWGAHAIQRSVLIDESKHLALRSSHPSARSFDKPCGPYPAFHGSRPFSQANAYLAQHQLPDILWTDEA